MENVLLFGPSEVVTKIKTNHPGQMIGESYKARKFLNRSCSGGSLLGIGRILNHLKCNNTIYTYLGSDEYANQILREALKDNLNIIVQKIPNTETIQTFEIFDSYNYTKYSTSISNEFLNLWIFRIPENFYKKTIYIDPKVPIQIQEKIINNARKCNFILRKPFENNYNLFDNLEKKDFFIVLNEWEAFTLCSEKKFNYFDPKVLLKSGFLKNNNVIIDSKEVLYASDTEGIVYYLDYSKLEKKKDVITDHFISGFISGISANNDLCNSATLGLLSSINNSKNRQYDKKSLINELKNFNWKIA